jgi:hypothetical protein
VGDSKDSPVGVNFASWLAVWCFKRQFGSTPTEDAVAVIPRLNACLRETSSIQVTSSTNSAVRHNSFSQESLSIGFVLFSRDRAWDSRHRSLAFTPNINQDEFRVFARDKLAQFFGRKILYWLTASPASPSFDCGENPITRNNNRVANLMTELHTENVIEHGLFGFTR